jgi:hypothetical protein
MANRCKSYHLVIQHSHGKLQFLIGKPSINGPFPMAMLKNQRVIPKKGKSPGKGGHGRTDIPSAGFVGMLTKQLSQASSRVS